MVTRLLLEGSDLAELMAQVREELGPGARVVSAERVRSGGLAGFFARERFELTVDVPEPAPSRPRGLRGPAPVRPAAGIEALLAAADASDALPDGSLPEPFEPAPPGLGRPWPTAVSTGGPSFAAVLDQVRSMAGAPEPADIEVPAPPPEDPLRVALRGLGVPDELLGVGTLTLPAVLARIPAPPPTPRGPGQVIAVVGAEQDVDAVAWLLAERLRVDRSAVMVAGAPGARTAARTDLSRATRAAEVAGWRDHAARATHPGVLSLAVGPDPADRAEAATLLRAARADQAWAVVDARTKTADAATWIAQVGDGGIGAVAVRGLFDTAQPGTVLDLGVPVVWVDGVPATTVAWAAALGQALGPRPRWDTDAPGAPGEAGRGGPGIAG
ncbi:hypothetical protein [Cellulomonas fengjieae]|uniref:Uncharacterized protein n=1 Tax=Cellulomonas fengjieae TaxID=2819978 RepID=A0ABS3SGZ2_9CELL|nr:hypothetical protein [Cellulomonas fengjieae]MBO3084917.1 hypothetical protein [Cellulomonas fengjieae]MBO3100664.1 hypothetical protein [Cellulomonas fengjieae]QVI66480.1 hypothetical protein KG102_02410 [Cellulomonas fengjieae]